MAKIIGWRTPPPWSGRFPVLEILDPPLSSNEIQYNISLLFSFYVLQFDFYKDGSKTKTLYKFEN